MGENTLQGGHFGHFHEMYVIYIFTKCVTFNFSKTKNHFNHFSSIFIIFLMHSDVHFFVTNIFWNHTI
jgi:hypothetical protein